MDVDGWPKSPPPFARMQLALLQGVERLESLINGVLFLQMVFCSPKKLVGTHRQCILGLGNPLHRALLIGLKESRDIESSPSRWYGRSWVAAGVRDTCLQRCVTPTGEEVPK